MMLTREESEARLNSSRNLNNRFGNNKFDDPEEDLQISVPNNEKTQTSITSDPIVNSESEPEEISAEEYDRMIQSDEEANVEYKSIGLAGRKAGVKGLSEDDRTEIAVRGILGQSQNDIAKKFGVTQPAISYIERNKAKKVDYRPKETVVQDIKDRALQKLYDSLGLIDDDKMANLSAEKLSRVGQNLAGIVNNLASKEQSNGADKIQVIIYQPELRKEAAFNTIEI